MLDHLTVWVTLIMRQSQTRDCKGLGAISAMVHADVSRAHAGRLEASEREAMQLRKAAEEARAAAAKLEADLEGLSGAYNSLEMHSFTLEARLRQLESSAGSLQQGAAAVSGTKAHAEDEEDGDDDGGMNDLLICLGQASHSLIKGLPSRRSAVLPVS